MYMYVSRAGVYVCYVYALWLIDIRQLNEKRINSADF